MGDNREFEACAQESRYFATSHLSEILHSLIFGNFVFNVKNSTEKHCTMRQSGMNEPRVLISQIRSRLKVRFVTLSVPSLNEKRWKFLSDVFVD